MMDDRSGDVFWILLGLFVCLFLGAAHIIIFLIPVEYVTWGDLFRAMFCLAFPGGGGGFVWNFISSTFN